MSNSRTHRRRVAGARLAATLAEADAFEPTYVGPAPGGGELGRAGPVLTLVASIPAGAPPELAETLNRRRRASLTGRCACGDRRHLGRANRPASLLPVVHAKDCPAADGAVIEALEAWKPVTALDW